MQPIDEVFSGIFCIRLALRNIGQTFDESVNVRLILDKDSFVTIMSFEDQMLQNTFDKFDDIFAIRRGKHYFAHDTAERSISNMHDSFTVTSSMDLDKRWNELFPYFVSVDDKSVTIETDFDRILHNTAIAFPTVILLRKQLHSIKYEMRSKYISKIISGEIFLKISEQEFETF